MTKFLRRSGVGLIFLALVVIGIALWAKPLRVVVPEWFGMTCVHETLCLDDVTLQDRAEGLVARAEAFVDREIGPVDARARVLFCSTQTCFSQFGDPQVAALYFWGLSTVLINENG